MMSHQKLYFLLITNESYQPVMVEVQDQKKNKLQIDETVIDLCSIRPSFTNNIGSQVLLPFRLLLQHWSLKFSSELVIDCGQTKAIALNPDIETVSMRSLFSHNSTISDATKNSASMFFAQKLNDFYPYRPIDLSCSGLG